MSPVTAVIQARLGSSRFPGKMLATLGGHTLLEWVVSRVSHAASLNRVVVATTQDSVDDRLVKVCNDLGVEAVRGSTNDVLARFADALRGDPAQVVVRICADNPFVDPECIDVVVRELAESGCDYAFNHRPLGDCNYPDGFGAEAMTRTMFDSLATQALSSQQREHVTLAIVDGSLPARMHACRAEGPLKRRELRFDVDTPDHLATLENFVRTKSLDFDTTASEIIEQFDQFQS